jgi:hypothetical protein
MELNGLVVAVATSTRVESHKAARAKAQTHGSPSSCSSSLTAWAAGSRRPVSTAPARPSRCTRTWARALRKAWATDGRRVSAAVAHPGDLVWIEGHIGIYACGNMPYDWPRTHKAVAKWEIS